MKIRYFVILVVASLLSNISAFAGKDVTEVVMYNVSIRMNEGWSSQKQTLNDGFILTLTKDNSLSFVEITCVKRVIDPVVRANDIASKRSMQKHFEYMQIDEIQNAKLKKFSTKLLTYTNTYLNDVSKGGIYAFVFEGYTYTLEYFGQDNPKSRKELEKTVNTFSLSSAKKNRNIVELSEEYQDKSWKNYDDTTSLETKVEEYGDDLLVINTAKNHKDVGIFTEKEQQLADKIKELEQQEESLDEELEQATLDNDNKKIKKINKKLKAIRKEKEKTENQLKQIHNDNLKVKLKE